MATKPAPALKLDNVNIGYDNGYQALRHFSHAFEAGSFTALVGPSGCGKSTLLRAVAGLLPASAGTIENHGKGDIGLVFQEPTLLAWRSVYDNIALPLKFAKLSSAEIQSRVTHALEMVGLADRASSLPRHLSGGMKMRVSLARALAGRPQTLLLDEPFAALDELTQFRLDDDLRHIWQQEKPTIIFVTHSVTEAAYLAQHVLVMSENGEIAQEITMPARQQNQNFRAAPAYHQACAAISEALGHHAAAYL